MRIAEGQTISGKMKDQRLSADFRHMYRAQRALAAICAVTALESRPTYLDFIIYSYTIACKEQSMLPHSKGVIEKLCGIRRPAGDPGFETYILGD